MSEAASVPGGGSAPSVLFDVCVICAMCVGARGELYKCVHASRNGRRAFGAAGCSTAAGSRMEPGARRRTVVDGSLKDVCVGFVS
mmetsp:Transcript_8979/g.31650  ORF Transcript_8979/g.31650 Transcript_8979/m.31650 type:complete len:85 (-) Transcript_8979:716-970(-)